MWNFQLDFLEEFKVSLEQAINDCVGNDRGKYVKVVKRNKRLKQGDFLCFLPPDLDQQEQQRVIENVTKVLMSSSNANVFVKNINASQFMVSMDRAKTIETIIKEVQSARTNYGSMHVASSCQTIVNCVTLLGEEVGCVTLENVRALLLSIHIACLLRNAGMKPEFVRRHASPAVWPVLNDYNINCEEFFSTEEEGHQQNNLEILQKISEKMSCEAGDECSSKDKKDMVINLRQFLNDQKLPFGKEGYDQNIQNCTVSEDSQIVQQLGTLEKCRCTQFGEEPLLCVHVVGFRQQFSQQQTDLCWRMLLNQQKSSPDVQQIHVVYGQVTNKSPSYPVSNAQDYFRLRLEQMKEASQLKHGDSEKGTELDRRVHELTVAAIKFELLSTVSNQKACLDFSPKQEYNDRGGVKGQDKGGVFVMYNCARISTLLEKFHTDVQQGKYPALPAVTEVDFSSLREEEEWALTFNYLLAYPSIVKETVAMALNSSNPRAPFNTHKVCQFLLDMSKDLSSYYNRIHILGESHVHLLPTMYARLYLLQSLHIVMCNALKLLDIEPPKVL